MINNKNKYLALSIILMLLLSYYLAIDKTLLLRRESIRLEKQSEQYSNIPKKLNLLLQKNKYYDSVLDGMDFNDTSIQNNLIRTINQTAKSHDVKVMDFNQPHEYQIGETTEFTYSFNLNGNFIDILNVLYKIEEKGSFGNIVHLDFEKTRDYKTNKSSLNATALIQQVK